MVFFPQKSKIIFLLVLVCLFFSILIIVTIMSTDNNKYVIVQINQCKCFVKAIKIQESTSGNDIFKMMKEKFNFKSPFRWSVVTSDSKEKYWSRILNIKKLIFNKNTRLRYDGFGKKWSSSETLIFLPDLDEDMPRKWELSMCPCNENSPCKQSNEFCGTSQV